MKYVYVLNGHSGEKYDAQYPIMSIGFFSSKKKAKQAKKEEEDKNFNESYPQFVKFSIDKVEVE